MSQSSIIAFFLLGGFIVYITIKGELPDYAGVLGVGPKGQSNTGLVAGTMIDKNNVVQSTSSIASGIY